MTTARVASGWPLPILRIAALCNRLAFFPVALANAPCTVVPEPKMRHIERRHRNANQIASLPANHLAVSDVSAQVLADSAADNLSKAALIALNFHDHGL